MNSNPKNDKSSQIKLDLDSQEAFQLAGIIKESGACKNDSLLIKAFKEQVTLLEGEPAFLKLRSILCLIIDFLEQGWQIKIEHRSKDDTNSLDINQAITIYMSPFDFSESNESAEAIKNKMRLGLQVGAKENLLQDDTQKFIKRMHQDTVNRNSISSLIDSSDSLLTAFLDADTSKDDYLKKVIDPYVQEVTPNTKDEFSNQYLSDIWRYFRLTWSLEHKNNPGRSMGFLIRNRARKNHPIIGISMLASPVLGLGPRDSELRLTVKSFLDFVKNNKIALAQLIEIMQQDITRSLRYLKKSDLISKNELATPDEQTLSKMMHTYERAIEKKELAKKIGNDIEYDKYLFVGKRAMKLQKLLKQKIALSALKKDEKKYRLSIEGCSENEAFKTIVRNFILSKRTQIMATDVMDMSVCGAVFPYNQLIGGKLVALLMGSKEVGDFFNSKYGSSENEIATKMAGRPIRKKSTLRCLTTTSLYGTHSSQYNRLKLSMGTGKRPTLIEFKKLAKKTEGYGTFHFSNSTLKILDEHYKTSGSVSSVNYKFGEGSSPRLRRLRESMSYLGFSGDEFYKHKQKRIVYLMSLDKNLIKSIFGLAEYKPRLYSVLSISKGWRGRWLEQRIQNPKIQQSMKESKKEDGYLTLKISTSSEDLFNNQETK